MKQATADTESLRVFSEDKTFLNRLFDSLLCDVASVPTKYHMGELDANGVINELVYILEGLYAIAPGGNVYGELRRAEAVILSRLCKDLEGDAPVEPEIAPKSPAMHDGTCADTGAEGGLAGD